MRRMSVNFDVDTKLAMTPFFRTDPLLYHKFENMVIIRSGNYIHSVAQETRIAENSTMQKYFDYKVTI